METISIIYTNEGSVKGKLSDTAIYWVTRSSTDAHSSGQHFCSAVFSAHVLIRACTGTPTKQKAELSVKLGKYTRVLERQIKAWFLEKWS